MLNLASIQKIIAPLFPGLMGIEFKVLELDRVVAELNVRPDLCTSGDIMHGGAYMAFAEPQKTAADQVDCRQTHGQTKALPGQPGDRA